MCLYGKWCYRAKFAKFIVFVNFWFSISKLFKKSAFFVCFCGFLSLVLTRERISHKERCAFVAFVAFVACVALLRCVSRFPFNIAFAPLVARFRFRRVNGRAVRVSLRGGFVCFPLPFSLVGVRLVCLCALLLLRLRLVCMRSRFALVLVLVPACAPAPTPPVCARDPPRGGVTPTLHFQFFFILGFPTVFKKWCETVDKRVIM